MGPFAILSELHRELEGRLAAIESGEEPGEPGMGPGRLEELLVALRAHARLEERHLYPVLTRVEGHVRAREQAEDQLTLHELLKELEELKPGDDEWWACFTALEDLVVAHVREQEAEIFPRLTSALDSGEQDELHQAFLALREELVSKPAAVPGSERLFEEPREYL